MRILLDTAPFLWLASGSPRLSESARRLVQDRAIQIHLSAVSGWEIAIKHSLGKLRLGRRPEELIPEARQAYQIASLPLDEESALQAGRLPGIHRDPFDRMLICQAIVHGLTILTPDEEVRAYPVRTTW